MIVLGAVPMLLLAQHVSAGGAGHARYLLPTIPVVAAATAFVLTRVSPWLVSGVMVVLSLAELTRLPVAADLRSPSPGALVNPGVGPSVLGQPALGAFVALAVAGAVVLVGSHATLAGGRGRKRDLDSTTGASDASPAGRSRATGAEEVHGQQ
jgi:hypothetical protein